LIQFVTFRLADTFPIALRSEWEHLWKIEDNEKRRIELENYLDQSKGDRWLKRTDIAELVERNIRDHSALPEAENSADDNGDRNDRPPGSLKFRYQLRAWCIMPNHVHVLFKVGGVSMSEIVG